MKRKSLTQCENNIGQGQATGKPVQKKHPLSTDYKADIICFFVPNHVQLHYH